MADRTPPMPSGLRYKQQITHPTYIQKAEPTTKPNVGPTTAPVRNASPPGDLTKKAAFPTYYRG